MSTPRYSKETHALQRALATDYAIAYCKKHGYSCEKLKKMRFDVVLNHAIFSHPSDVKPDGLRNDLATLQYPTLIVTFDGEKLDVETTEHTDKYLKD